MRKLPALVVAASVLAALTACSSGSGGSDSSNCDSDVSSGEASSIVDAPGEIGTAPEVTFPQPLISTSVERSVVIRGDEAPLRNGQPVIIEATIMNGTDGSVLQQTPYAEGGGSMFTVGDTGLPALGTALECATVGSRVAIVASGEDSAGEGATPTEDSVVYVVDVLRAFEPRASGENQLPVAGMPSVVVAPDGTPGITIPREDPPTDYRKSVLKLGEGATVKEDDVAVVKLTTVDWNTLAVVDSTWSTGSSTIIDLSGPNATEGLKRAIVGETVGSQVLAVVPPGLAGDGEAPSAATLVYVVDILGTVN